MWRVSIASRSTALKATHVYSSHISTSPPTGAWQGSANDLTLDFANTPATSSTLASCAADRDTPGAHRPEGDEAALAEAEILETAIEVAFRLGDSFARQLFDRILPIVDRLNSLSDRVNLLERALRLAVHFDHAGHARPYVAIRWSPARGRRVVGRHTRATCEPVLPGTSQTRAAR